jgi:hypothetical protein
MKANWFATLAVVSLCGVLLAQTPPATAQAVHEPNGNAATPVDERLDQVLAALSSMQHQLDDSRQQVEQLRTELQEVRGQMKLTNADTPAADAAASALQSSVQQLQSNDELLQAQVKQHEQTKVESTSKYPVKVTGLLLFSSFSNDGAVDNIDLPIIALRRDNTVAHGSLAATLRQTVLGLESSGPTIWGARSLADVHVDFFGGVPYADYTTSSGVLRLRTAHARLDWPDHSLIAALDSPLITPLQPTSYVGIGEPPLAWSGNLWIWAPQLQWTNRLRLKSGKLGLDFSLIDAPSPGSTGVYGQGQPNAAERSRQPGYEARVSYSIPFMDRSFTVGAGGYYSRHTYPYQQHIDAWAGTADWHFPLTRWLDLSGSLYRGRALGGLGAGVYKDYLTDPVSGKIYGLDDEGGWSQLKARLSSTLEANFAIGEDAGFSSELRDYMNPALTDVYSDLARNRTVLANIIFRPKTYLLFSAEYRNIHSYPISGQVNTSQSLGLATGYSF